MKTTSVFAKNIEAYNKGYRYLCNKGSTRSSKTYSLSQLLYLIARQSKKPLLISVVSETMPHLKRGCIRDFQNMLQEEGVWRDKSWNATDKVYKVGKSKIEFFSADSPDKVRGPARDILFCNECNNIPYETIRQLAVRTRKTIFLDYNPVEEFWIDSEILPRQDAILIHSTYKDNEYLSDEQVKEIEANKHDINWWNVYGLGITGSREGLCIKEWEQVEELPKTYKGRWLGIDFGFTNDPTGIVDVYLSNGELWLDEVTYDRGLTNPKIAQLIKGLKLSHLTAVCDSAEPKSIQELKDAGIKAEESYKGKDSIKNGIDTLNRYRIHVTKRSVNLIKELRTYKYKQDANGKYTNEPIDKFNHLIDPVRYVASRKLGVVKKRKPIKTKVCSIQ